MDKMLVRQIVSAALGLAAAILLLTIGFWKTVLIVALASIGWWLGGERKISKATVEVLYKAPQVKDFVVRHATVSEEETEESA